MSDLRKPIATVSSQLVVSAFKFLLWGDDVPSLLQKVQELKNKKADFYIYYFAANGQLAEELKEFCHLKIITDNQLTQEELASFSVIYLYFSQSKITKEILNQLSTLNILVGAPLEEENCGNFIEPIGFEEGGFEVLLHTQGRTDRRARTLRDYLQRHTKDLLDGTLIVLGTDHNCIPLETRECFHLPEPRYSIVSDQLSLVSGVQEFFILNTCNRVELYAIASKNAKVMDLLKKILNFDHLGSDQYYVKYDRDAFRHMALVLSGLYAQIPGETHVVQQLKLAIDNAKSQGFAGGLLQQLFDNCLFVSKSIRQIIMPHLAQLEIEDLTVKYMHEKNQAIHGKKILILGAGVVGQGLIERLLLHQPAAITLCYRTNVPHLEKYENDIYPPIQACQLESLPEVLKKTDTIISAVNSSRYVLHSHHLQYLNADKEIVVVDVCVPRSVHPGFYRSNEQVHYADIEELKRWYLGVIKELGRLKDLANEEINQRMKRYEKVFDKEWLQE